MDEYALVFYTMVEQANLMQIEDHLASLTPKERAIEENRLEALGYNVGNEHSKEKDKQKLKELLGNG